MAILQSSESNAISDLDKSMGIYEVWENPEAWRAQLLQRVKRITHRVEPTNMTTKLMANATVVFTAQLTIQTGTDIDADKDYKFRGLQRKDCKGLRFAKGESTSEEMQHLPSPLPTTPPATSPSTESSHRGTTERTNRRRWRRRQQPPREAKTKARDEMDVLAPKSRRVAKKSKRKCR